MALLLDRWDGMDKVRSIYFFRAIPLTNVMKSGIAQPGILHPMNMAANQQYNGFNSLMKTRKLGVQVF